MNTHFALTADVRLLVYTAFISIVMWLPYLLAAIRFYGLRRMVGYPACDYIHIPRWAQRLHRAHLNMGENLAPFAVLVIVAQMTGAANELTALGARMFFWSRIVQIAGHTAAIPWVRTLGFLAGWAGMILIFTQVIWR